MSNKLLQEAIADAKKVKEIAYENAKAAIEEAFQPRIQRMISTKLAEDDLELEPEAELGMGAEADPFAPAPEADPFAPEEDPYAIPESYIDDGKNGTPDNPIKDFGFPQTGLDEEHEEEVDEQFEAIIKELEGAGVDEDLEEGDRRGGGGYPHDIEKSSKNGVKAVAEMTGDKKAGSAYDQSTDGAKNGGKVSIEEMGDYGDADMKYKDDEPEEEVYEGYDDLSLEELVKKLEEEEVKASKSAKKAAPTNPVKTENLRLRKENQDVYKALAEMKNTMNEVNLLNSKLMYSSKIIQSFDLTEAQQVKILETFDRAISVREVKLIYATIQENYRGKAAKTRRQQKMVSESASRTIRTAKPNPKSDLMEGADRWKILAGLKPIND